jgi:endonuclease G
VAQTDRIREARRRARDAALARWVKRAAERERNVRDVRVGGIGGADSPQRNERFRERRAVLSAARELRGSGMLPFAIERKIGPTLDWTPFAPSEGAREAGRPVARIVELGAGDVVPEGIATGFLVSPRLLMTNHHVFPSRADARGTGANFAYERSDRGLRAGEIFEIDADAFYAGDERLDYAVVAVKPRSLAGASLTDFRSITLIEATPKILIGQRVPIIQHPDGGPKAYAITQNRLVDVLEEGFLHYETDTQEGSSGSPAFSEDWQLVALHHAGIPETRDGRVVAMDGRPWLEEMGDDRVHWIANEGARVSALVKHLAGLRLEGAAERSLLAELLATTSDPVDELERQGVAPSPGALEVEHASRAGGALPTAGGSMPYNLFSFSAPVTINVHAPAPAPVAAAAADRAVARADVQVTPAALEASIRFDPEYELREGYDPAFLDREAGGDDEPEADGDDALVVPVPGVVEGRRGDLLRGGDGAPLVLEYHHFELVMNAARRLQMWSAANVDYSPGKKSKRSREAFGRDRWIPDPRIPALAQIFDADFYKPAGNIDRGHVVRREDNAWGESEDEIEFANSDTFHWTNCTPQHEAFNQSDPGRSDPTYRGMKGIWGDFENHIQAQLTADQPRACILSGPVLDDANDPTADFGRGPIRYPLRFWKVVAVAEPAAGGKRALRTFGFIFSQKRVVDRFGIEVFGAGKFKRYQVPLRRITDIAGVTFDDRLHAADAMKGERDAVPVVSADEIRGLRAGEARKAEYVAPDA